MCLFCFTKILNLAFYMTHTFDSEVSLHYWMLWPTVCRCRCRRHQNAAIVAQWGVSAFFKCLRSFESDIPVNISISCQDCLKKSKRAFSPIGCAINGNGLYGLYGLNDLLSKTTRQDDNSGKTWVYETANTPITYSTKGISFFPIC